MKQTLKELGVKVQKPDLPKLDDQADDEDLGRDSEMDIFEKKYNFRYEESNAATITSHARNAGEEETIRRKDSTRKDARERKKDRKEEEKAKKREEINRLKQMKKEEILERLKKAEFLSGAKFSNPKDLEKIQKELETDFIPDLYDKTMEKLFDDQYYKDENKDDKKQAKKADLNLKLLKDADIDQGNESGSESDAAQENFAVSIANELKEKVVEKANKD